MLESVARVPTEKADKYANRLCKHFAHKIEAKWTSPGGIAEFPELGTFRMEARADELVLRIEAPDAEKLARVHSIVGDHLEQLGKRDGQPGEAMIIERPSTDFAGAPGYSSPLSLPFALDIAVPRLAAAMDGDPETATEQTTG